MKVAKKVLVTGANGQLGKCLQELAPAYSHLQFTFASRDVLDIEDAEAIRAFFNTEDFDYCINAAAYTNVEKAEGDKEAAFMANAEAVKWLAVHCAEKEVVLLHISTDYVFDGKKEQPYAEDDAVGPINVYGASKLVGEGYIRELTERYFILRTSWLYCQYGHNFLNTILRYAKEGKPLTITTEQVGTPTNANDLAEALVALIESDSEAYGVYHFSNEGKGTWYDFAKAILEDTQQLETTELAQTAYYRTFAERPKYSVLDKTLFKRTFQKEVLHWRDSLRLLLEQTNN